MNTTTKFDRDAAREVLADKYGPNAPDAQVLDALEACVRPAPQQTIDRDALEHELQQWFCSTDDDRIDPEILDGILGLVRPVDGVLLTREEAEWCRDLVTAEREAAAGHPDYDDSGAAMLLTKLGVES